MWRPAGTTPSILLVSLLGLPQLLGMALWFVAARRKLILAVAIEMLIGVCALVFWCVPAPPL